MDSMIFKQAFGVGPCSWKIVVSFFENGDYPTVLLNLGEVKSVKWLIGQGNQIRGNDVTNTFNNWY